MVKCKVSEYLGFFFFFFFFVFLSLLFLILENELVDFDQILGSY